MPIQPATVKPAGPLDDHGRKTGVWQTNHSNGQLAEESTYAADQLDGESRGWSRDGVLQFERNYSDGKLNGVQTEFSSDGRKTTEYTMLLGSHHGNYKKWFADGTLELEGEFLLGRQHGLWQGKTHRFSKPAQMNFAYGVQLKSQLMLDGIGPTNRLSALLIIAVLGLVAFAAFKDVNALTGLLALSIALVVHELGHWLAARMMGITVTEFRIGFGPRIAQFVCARTVFCVHLFPLVGWVKEAQFFDGEQEHLRRLGNGEVHTPVADIEKITTLPSQPAKPASKSVNRAKQIVFLTGGVAANFLLGFIILWTVLGKSPVEAISRTAKVTTNIVSVVPEAVGEQLSPAIYTKDRPGLFRATRNASRSGQPFSFHLGILNLLLVAVNILPVPPLDGFRVLVCLIESIIRRPIPQRILDPMFRLGGLLLTILIVSGVFLMGRDFIQMIRGF